MEDFKLYKYMKRTHANSMINNGLIRIGTYYEYKKMDNDKQRGDPNETLMTYEHTFDKNTNHDELPDLFSQNLMINGIDQITFEKGSKIVARRHASDNYLFCCSKIFSAELMNDFEAECCVEIFNVEQFAQKLFDKLVESHYIYNHGVAGDCNYIGHHVDLDFKGTAHLLKDISYSHQKEYRFFYPAIIKDNNGEILKANLYKDDDGTTQFRIPDAKNYPLPVLEPIFITCKEAVQFCRILN
jgi:hypothetical protein